MASLSGLAFLVALAAQLTGAGAIRERAREALEADAQTKFIAGVPVYNYHRAYEAIKMAGSSLAEVEQESEGPLTTDWIVVMKPSIKADSKLKKICVKFMKKKKCVFMGNPKKGGAPFAEVHGSEEDLKEIIEDNDGEVDFIEPDMVLRLPEKNMVPPKPENDTVVRTAAASAPWGLARIGAGSTAATGKGVHIYVLDTGIRTSHSDFGGRADSALEVTSNSPRECRGRTDCAVDRQGHGTHCAGTAAGSKYGVAKEASIHAVKVLGDEGEGMNSWTLAAIDWVITKGKRPAVISMSLGGEGNSRAEEMAIKQAVRAGVTVVVAAGNDNADACDFTPAFVPSAITVGATDSSNSRASYSCYGKCVNIWAPGSRVTSASHASDYGSQTMDGTSMACPHVSGAAALLLGENPKMTPTQVRNTLVADGYKDKISGLHPQGNNIFLNVRNVGSGSAPAPSPVRTPAPTPAPRPAPTPAPRPATGLCPSWSQSIYPDDEGDCRCPEMSMCFTGYRRGCAYSRTGWASDAFFKPSCTVCKCMRFNR